MRVGGALLGALRAPVRQWRLSVLLWLARLLPIVVVFGLPVFDRIAARTAYHPDAGLLLDSRGDAGGFVFAWTDDFFRIEKGLSDNLFWLMVFAWLAVSVLAGGIASTLLRGRREGVLSASGRYAGRFLRLALLVAILFYALDVACNTLLARAHERVGRAHHTQDYALGKEWMRGLLFLAVLHLVGLIHAYARLDIVANERRSALLSLLRGLGTLVSRLPRLLILETGILLLAGFGVVLAWVALRGAHLLHPDASWMAVGVFLGLAALTSYLRTGFEIGALGARCQVLYPIRPEPDIVSQVEAALGEAAREPPPEPEPEEEEAEYELPPPADEPNIGPDNDLRPE